MCFEPGGERAARLCPTGSVGAGRLPAWGQQSAQTQAPSSPAKQRLTGRPENRSSRTSRLASPSLIDWFDQRLLWDGSMDASVAQPVNTAFQPSTPQKMATNRMNYHPSTARGFMWLLAEQVRATCRPGSCAHCPSAASRRSRVPCRRQNATRRACCVPSSFGSPTDAA